MWIDLTNTNRFYDKAEVVRNGCRYTKIPCKGHGECPSDEQRNFFFKIVDEFSSKYPLESIVVHCTHGFNRTGYLIISYLVAKCDFDVHKALQTFAQFRYVQFKILTVNGNMRTFYFYIWFSRPVGIYKASYIQKLFKRYGGGSGTCPPAPPLPDWCDDDANDLDDFDDIEETESSSSQ